VEDRIDHFSSVRKCTINVSKMILDIFCYTFIVAAVRQHMVRPNPIKIIRY